MGSRAKAGLHQIEHPNARLVALVLGQPRRNPQPPFICDKDASGENQTKPDEAAPQAGHIDRVIAAKSNW